VKATLPCAIESCDHSRYAREFCKAHYSNWSFNGDPFDTARPSCSIESCQKPARSKSGRQWCSMHAERWRVFGTTNPARVSVEDRFLSLVNTTTEHECHEWKGSRSPGGYGRFRVGRKTVLANRWLLGHLRGVSLTEDELALHHCDNPPCCNPRHLYIGTHTDNMQDAVKRDRFHPWNAGKQVCVHGHALNSDNVYVAPNGTRKCRTCRAAAQQRYLERRRGAA